MTENRKVTGTRLSFFPFLCSALDSIQLQYMTSHTLKIRELKEELFDHLDPHHCRKSKMDAYTSKKLEKRTIEKRCSLLIF